MELIDNTVVAYLIGVDEADYNISEGKIVCTFKKDSKRYVCMKLAISAIKEYEDSPREGKVLLPLMQQINDCFREVIDKASLFFKGVEVIYSKETKDVIEALEEILQKNNY